MPANFSEIMDAFEYASFGMPHEQEAYLGRHTGKIYFHSEYGDNFEELPEDIDDGEKYIALPHKNELGLGKRLAVRFAAQHLPDEFERVEAIFRKRGAYSRFKDLLSRSDALEKWYAFEAKAQEEALREWCEANGIKIGDAEQPEKQD